MKASVNDQDNNEKKEREQSSEIRKDAASLPKRPQGLNEEDEQFWDRFLLNVPFELADLPFMNMEMSMTNEPTLSPNNSPTTSPTQSPVASPSQMPSVIPTRQPSTTPTSVPTRSPTKSSSKAPTQQPSTAPSSNPTQEPTTAPFQIPTKSPTQEPTGSPMGTPTNTPTREPTESPMGTPTGSPMGTPTGSPMGTPTGSPSRSPTQEPTGSPMETPTNAPSKQPSFQPSTGEPTLVCETTCDFVFATLDQNGPLANGTLIREGRGGTCEEPKEFPGVQDEGVPTPYAELGPFCSPEEGQSCARVIVDLGSCILGGSIPLVQVAAYDGPLDPQNLESGYLGDTGEELDLQLVTAPQTTFTLVAFFSNLVSSEILPCEFNVFVDFGECPTPSPTTTLVPSSLPTFSPTTEEPTQTQCSAQCENVGAQVSTSSPKSDAALRVTNEINSCTAQKEVPEEISSISGFFYESIGPFCNGLPTEECAVVSIDQGSCVFPGNVPLIHVVAYSPVFDPNNVQDNYVGDGEFESFQVLMPPNSVFFLVGFYSLITPPTFPPCTFEVSVDLGRCTPSTSPSFSSSPTLVPSGTPTSSAAPSSVPTLTPTPNADCLVIPSIFMDNGLNMNGRIARSSAIPSNCDVVKPYPGTFGARRRAYNKFGFANQDLVEKCTTVIWDFGNCINVVNETSGEFDVLLHPTVYSPFFNSSDLSQNFLSDGGTSVAPSFSFIVPPQTDFEFVAQEVQPEGAIVGQAFGCEYSIEIRTDDCPTTSPTSSPSVQPSLVPTVSPSGTPSVFPSTTPPPTNVPNCEAVESTFTNTSQITSGRLRRTQDASTCENNKTFPGTLFVIDYLYNEIGPFKNNDSEERCVTIEWNFGNCTANGETLLQPMAYTQFNPLNQAEGFLGDGGPGNSASFSFFVPAQTEFVFVAQEVRPPVAPGSGVAIGCTFALEVVLDCAEEALVVEQDQPDDVTAQELIEDEENPDSDQGGTGGGTFGGNFGGNFGGVSGSPALIISGFPNPERGLCQLTGCWDSPIFMNYMFFAKKRKPMTFPELGSSWDNNP